MAPAPVLDLTTSLRGDFEVPLGSPQKANLGLFGGHCPDHMGLAVTMVPMGVRVPLLVQHIPQPLKRFQKSQIFENPRC